MLHGIEIPVGGRATDPEFDLIDIVERIEEQGKRFSWWVYYIGSIYHEDVNPEDHGAILRFSRDLEKSATGLPILWPDLKQLADQTYQVINGVFLGYEEGAELFDAKGKCIQENCEFIFVAFDSTNWQVFAKDEDIIRVFEKDFVDAKRIPAPYTDIGCF